jgi:hypothetical protein
MSSIRQPARDFFIDVSLGRVRTNNRPWLTFTAFGASESIGTTEGALKQGSGTFVFPQSAQRVRVKAGGNANDTVSGTGARSIFIYGLDSDLNLRLEELDTAGASASGYTVNSYWRVFDVGVRTVGTYGGSNVGDITLQNEADQSDLIVCTAGIACNLHGAFAVPENYKGFITHVNFSVAGNKLVTFFMRRREELNKVTAPFRANRLCREFPLVPAGSYEHNFAAPFEVEQLTDLFVNAETDTGTASGSFTIFGLLVPIG